jgi:hypothetical protein
MDSFFGTYWALENGNEIWNLELYESAQGIFTENTTKRVSKI